MEPSDFIAVTFALRSEDSWKERKGRRWSRNTKVGRSYMSAFLQSYKEFKKTLIEKLN